MEKISSVNNKLIKDLVKLKQKKYREETGLYLIEGFHLIEEALKANRTYVYLLGTSAALSQAETAYQADLTSKKVIQINEAIVHHLTSTKNPQNIFMVLKVGQPKHYPFDFGKWVLLDDLADPGNVGTIIRTVDAAGFDGVVLSPLSVDLYNPKTQRAMQGSQFHIELLVQDLGETIAALKGNGIPVYASMLDTAAQELPDFRPVPQLGLVIGNEARGVTPAIARNCDEKLYIPIKGQAESLNAAVAAGIMIYHFA
ncbi:TrmH family RNA methyltransferase [Lactobacillus xylocopicola]|uniref:rRNA methyltransferase n=1 Tax=Lactobacillus xylocopicola TaxID=2976676 RepID=A0ABM8BHF0_9LACO|nr:RNA methyltransferase [Lactobacillus xylocopicola]BDR60727.1 rRNA methyltransferase [Lactobacillus xylocopicola]